MDTTDTKQSPNPSPVKALRLNGRLIVEGKIEKNLLHLTRSFNGLVQHKFLRADLYGVKEEDIQIAVNADADFCADWLEWRR